MMSHQQEVLKNISSNLLSDNKNLQTALSTLLLNYAILSGSLRSDESKTLLIESLIESLLKMLEKPQDDDSLFRIIIALGTLAYCNQDAKKSICNAIGTLDKQNTQGTDKTKESTIELKQLLSE
eukprot:TRINITY_DN10009_c0_g1_i2.p1 TRINITY_DN10009_c0_g1~~TRINITY_DN10009_c0_g1_i2.p1  ORF type:complete len:124 (-),score=15.23 TRINITY_DN10009_c0_g1_i2:15-386(-)